MLDPYDKYCETFFQKGMMVDGMCLNGWSCDQTFCPDHRPFDTWEPREWPDLERSGL